MTFVVKPRRKHRSDWWAEWGSASNGVAKEDHAIGHTTWTDFAKLYYRDGFPGRAESVQETVRSLRVIELLQKTGILIIQNDAGGRDRGMFAFKGWHSAWRIANLKIRPCQGVWFECDLVECLTHKFWLTKDAA